MSVAGSKLNDLNLSSKLRPHCKLWLSAVDGDTATAEMAFGDGRWRLLETLETTGSLRAGAEELGISYRKAWGDLQKAEECLSVKLIDRRRGGVGGGETTLTTAGEDLLRVYRAFRQDVKKAVDEAYARHFAKL